MTIVSTLSQQYAINSIDQSAKQQIIAAAQAGAIAASNTQFVYFAAFDGTNNNLAGTGSGLPFTTNVAQLYHQVNNVAKNNPDVYAGYFAGPGTENSVPTSSAFSPAVTLQEYRTALAAYELFTEQADLWLSKHSGGSVAVALTSFSRGDASAAIFSQLLYDRGLLDKSGNVLIAPGNIGVSAGVIFDPVTTGTSGNLAFAPNVKNVVSIVAANEYRRQFEKTSYGVQSGQVVSVNVDGNHSDIGGGYDQGIGAITLDAATTFLENSGLPIAASNPAYREDAGAVYIHSEVTSPIPGVPWLQDEAFSWPNPPARHVDTNVTVTPATQALVNGASSQALTLQNGSVVKITTYTTGERVEDDSVPNSGHQEKNIVDYVTQGSASAISDKIYSALDSAAPASDDVTAIVYANNDKLDISIESDLFSTLKVSAKAGIDFSTASVDIRVTNSGTQVTSVLVGASNRGSSQYSWTALDGTRYSYAPSSLSVGSLTVSGGALGDAGNQLLIFGFDLNAAETNPLGYLGIKLAGALIVAAGTSTSSVPQPAIFAQGSTQTYNVSVDAASSAWRTVALNLTGANPSDFELQVGQNITSLGGDGSFSVSVAPGESSVSFSLVDGTAPDGTSDLSNGAILQLSASLSYPGITTLQSAPLAITEIPESQLVVPAPKATTNVSGTLVGGVTVYQGDTGDDSIVAGAGPNNIKAGNSGNDIIVGGSGANTLVGGNGNDVITLHGSTDAVTLGGGYNTLVGGTGQDTIKSINGDDIVSGNGGTDVINLGNGTNQVYAGSSTSLANAIAQASVAVATGQLGDLISVLDGNNTVVGGNGNDLLAVGSGSDVVVMGPGNDTFLGGYDITNAPRSWLGGPLGFTYDLFSESYTNPYLQPYAGNYIDSGSAVPSVPFTTGNDTVFGGSGNDAILLGNGNNYVEMGSGNSHVRAGMGNNTIIAGSGADWINGGGGNEYIVGGSASDTISGGNGNNTIIGGSGNSSLQSAGGLNGSSTPWLNDTLSQNYVFGGSGNDQIFGSYGRDTLIAGTGNTTIVGGSGFESIVGGIGTDVLYGGSGNDTLVAGSGPNSLYGGGSASSTTVFYGGSGSDVIYGGSGANVIYAGDGGSSSAPTLVFASSTDAGSTTTIYGGQGVSQLTGGAGTSVIYGGNGGTSSAPETIQAGSGATTVYGGLGTDLILGGSGTAVLYAGDGGTASAPASVFGGAGVATLQGGAGPNFLEDSVSGHDLLIGGSSDDRLIGIAGDTLVAGQGNDVLETLGGTFTAQLNANFADDTIGGFGSQTANLVFGTGIAPTDFTATTSTDVDGNSYLVLTGDGGSISVESGLTGGIGSISFADSGAISLGALLLDALGASTTLASGSNKTVINLDTAASISLGADPQDTAASFGSNATIRGGTAGAFGDVIYSAGFAASIVGGVGSDSLIAAGSNATVQAGNAASVSVTLSGANSVATAGSNSDILSASGVNDTLIAGSYITQFVVGNATTIIQGPNSQGANSVLALVNYVLPASANILTLTGNASISGTGNAGNDTLTGSTGVDTLIAGSGLATMIGGSGNTTFVVNNAGDVVQDSFATASNTVQSSVNYVLPTSVNTLVLTGAGSLTGTANSAADTLVSNSGVDTLIGGIGNDTFVINNTSDVVQDGSTSASNAAQASVNYTLAANVNTLVLTGTAALRGTANSGTDTLISNSGIDTLVGGSGNDTFVVNNPADVVQDSSTTASNTIQASVNYVLPTNVNALVLTGTANLTATGNAASDVLRANAGNDTLIAGAGVATLVGGAGNDTFVVNNAADVVQDGSTTASNIVQASVSYVLPTNVNTLVLTGTANLTATANAGTDTLISNSGIDTLVGGTGNDTFIVNNASDVVQDASTTSSDVIQSVVSYTLSTNVNTLVLTGSANLVGTANSGNDSIVGNAGNDTLIATTGNDTLVAGTGITTLKSGTGNDVFVVNNAADVVSITGTPGADTILSSVSYTLPTSVYVLTLTGAGNLVGTGLAAGDSITGNAGNDTLVAGPGSDTLVAGSGLDTLVGGSGPDTFVINNTADVIQNISAIAGNTVLSSVSYTMQTNIGALYLTGAGSLLATGNGSNDTIVGNAGTDTLVAGSGLAALYGGTGADLFVVNNTGDYVEEDNYGFKSGADTIDASVSFTLPTGVNNLVLTGSANLAATGNRDADSIVGNAGNDTLTAGVGNDTLVAGTGLATLIGGAGNDTFVVDNAGDVVQGAVSGHNNVLVSSVSYVLPTNITTMVLSGSANLVATANSADDSITGNAGADTLLAGSGNDTLVAGSGVATLVGGAGNDTFVVNNAADIVQGASPTKSNALRTSVSYVLPTNVNSLTLTGNASISGTGNAGNDTLTGSTGVDTLIAGTGLATMIGGSGNTTFVVDNAGDVVQDGFATASNTVQSSVNYVLPTNVNTLVLTGVANLTGTANSAADTLVSNSGVDMLIGGIGNDTFVINNTSDVVQDSSTTASNTAQASVNYALAANVNTLVLTGTAALRGTANSGTDTLISNSGIDTLVGGSGNDTFVVNNAADVVQDSSTTASNTIQASVNYVLPTNVNALVLTGTANLTATGNAASDVLRANAGNDTLIAGAGVATLVGGAGNDTFVVNNAADVVHDSSTTASNTVLASVSYVLPTNVNTLTLTGTANLTATANAGTDTLVSNSGIDTLVGGAGNDTFIVNNSADVLVNVKLTDTVESSVSFVLPTNVNSVTLIGTGNASLTGNANSDTLTGGGANDTLVAGTGLSTLIGGTGSTTFVVNNTNDVVQDAYGSSTNTVSSSVTYTLPTNVDALTLTGSSNVTAYGNSDGANILTAGAGNDALVATAWNDTLVGGAGSDSILAGPGTNLIYAGSGGTTAAPTYVYGNATGTTFETQSTIYGGSGVDVLSGGAGTDLIYAGTGVDTLVSGSGFDSLYGNAGSLLIDSLSGYSMLVAGAGTETLSGIGSDTLVAGSGTDLLYAATVNGAATVYEINPGFGQATIGAGTLSSNDDIVFGSGFAPSNFTVSASVVGTSGTSADLALVLTDGAESLVVRGGFLPGVIGNLNFTSTGAESLTQFLSSSGLGTVTIPIHSGTDILSTASGQTITGGSNLQDIYAFGSNDLLTPSGVTGSAGTVYAYGNGDVVNDTQNTSSVWAGGLGDIINLGNSQVSVTVVGANDTVNGTSNETVYVGQSSDVVQMTAGGFNNVVNASANYTLPANVQSLTLTGSISGLTATSNGQGGTLTAANTFDTLIGGSGTDTLVAQFANDVLIGGAGVETYVLSSPTDSIQFGTGAASLNSVQAAFNYILPTGANNLSITVGGVSGTGNSANDSMTAAGSYDTLVAGSGADTLTATGNYADVLVAGSGTDTLIDQTYSSVVMIGGSGNDTFVVRNTGDQINDTSTTSSNTVQSSVNFVLPTNVNTLVLTNSSISGTGNSANDLITDTGRDTLVAGTGNDTLAAGGGNDTIVFNAGFGHDVVTNAGNNDFIQFGAGITQSSLTFTGVAGNGSTAPSLVITGTSGAITVQGGLAPGAISGIAFTGGATSTVAQLIAPSGVVTIPGSNGNLIFTTIAAASVTGGSGQDTIYASGNNDTLSAGAGGANIVSAGTGGLLRGGSGADTLSATGGNSTLVGGSGNEVLIVSDPTTVVQVAAGVGHDTVLSSVSYTVPANVSVLTLTGPGSITATGNAGNDTITAGLGFDTLVAGTGVDTLIAGSGPVTFVVNNSSDVILKSSSTARGAVLSSVSYTLPTNVNSMTLAGGGSIAGTAVSQNNYLDASTDFDTLIGGSGNDTLDAEASRGYLIGGSGNDSLYCGGLNGGANSLVSGTGIDTISWLYSPSLIVINNSADVINFGPTVYQQLTVQSSVSYTLGSSAVLLSNETFQLIGSGNLVFTDQNHTGIAITGNAGNDTITGGDLSNHLTAGTGIDTLISGGAGSANVFTVNNAADVVVGLAGSADTIISSASYTLPTLVDLLKLSGTGLVGTANAENDSIAVTAVGGDTLVGGSGNDTLAGTYGNTIANTFVAGSGTSLILAEGTYVVGTGQLTGGDTFVFNSNSGNSHVELPAALYGTEHVRFGAGVAASGLTARVAVGNDGQAALAITSSTGTMTVDDAFSRSISYDYTFSGGSALTLSQFLAQVNVPVSVVASGPGSLVLEAASSYVGGSGNDTIYAAGSADTLSGGTGSQLLVGLGANDVLVGGSAPDTLQGLGAGDTLMGGAAADALVGGTGNVLFLVNNGSDSVTAFGVTGVDTVSSSVSFALPLGYPGIDTLILTGTGALTGTANFDNDTLVSNSGADTLVGGTGNDLFILNNGADVVTVGATHGVDTIQSAFSTALAANVANLALTGSGNLSGTGNAIADVISANQGNDTLTAGTGVATLIGGVGNDLFVVNNIGDLVQVASTTVSDTINSSATYTLPANVNTLTLTGAGNLKGTGNAANDLLTANTGADTLVAGNGTDTLLSGSGIDSLVGGTGADLFIINNAADIVTVGATHGNDTIQSAVSFTLAANVAILLLTGTGTVTGTGNAIADVLTANAGVDTLTAGSGLATMIGGAGNDTFIVNNVGDVVQDAVSSTSNTIKSSVNYVLPTNVNTLVLTGTAALAGTGNAAADKITANGGADTLTAGSGVATLVGGAGNDTFVVNNLADVVQDAVTTTTNTILSSVSFVLPTNVNTLTLTGTTGIAGTGNAGADKLTANSGADTLTAGAGVATLVGGAGNDTFVVNSVSDVVQDAVTTTTNTIMSSVNYVLPTNVNTLTLTGTAALSGTGNAAADKLMANGGADTLTAGSGLATLIGGAGNDTFVVNNVGDVVQDAVTTTTNTISSSVNYVLPVNVNTLTLTGTAAISGTGNGAADKLTANSGADTLTAGSGVATLVGGAGNDTFVVNNTSDVVQDAVTTTVNSILSSVSYVLPTNVNTLTLTGAANIAGTGNAAASKVTANAGNDTLFAGSGVATLVGGAGNDTFVVNNVSDVVQDSVTTTSNVIQASVSYVLPTNVNSLTLTGSGNLSGTANTLNDLLIANSGADTLTGGVGVDVLEGGAGLDTLTDTAGQGALIGGAGSDTMTGGTHKSFFAAGKVSDTITTGATNNVVSFNKTSGALTLQPTTGATNILSLGAGIDTESLTFTKTGNNLILGDGTGDTVTFTNWYVGASNQNFAKLQVIELASASYSAASTDALRNQAIEEFNFTSVVTQFNTAGSPANWSLTTALQSAQLASSATAAYGGDLAYYEGLNGNVTSMNASAAQSTLTNASFATATQTIDPWASISGGTMHLNIITPVQPVAVTSLATSDVVPQMSAPVTTVALRSHAMSASPKPLYGASIAPADKAIGAAWGAMHAFLDRAPQAGASSTIPGLSGAEEWQSSGASAPGLLATGQLHSSTTGRMTKKNDHAALA